MEISPTILINNIFSHKPLKSIVFVLYETKFVYIRSKVIHIVVECGEMWDIINIFAN